MLVSPTALPSGGHVVVQATWLAKASAAGEVSMSWGFAHGPRKMSAS